MTYTGDCLDVLRTLADDSVDSIVTDPPYGLGFMGKHWDTYDKTQFGRSGLEGENDLKVKKNFNVLPRYRSEGSFYDFTLQWATECLRVLKPGGHLLSFGGSRTYHRMACAIEDAGFEIRDMVEWVYGSGFPKSRNITLDMDKMEGHPNRGHRIAVANRHHPDGTLEPNGENLPAYTPKSDNAIKWQGFGTALKPAHEPVCLARKPLSEKSVAENVLKWGTGGIAIDKCRVDFVSDADYKESTDKNQHADFGTKPMTNNNVYGDYSMIQPKNYQPQGRFPANLCHDGSDEVLAVFPNTTHGGSVYNEGTVNNWLGKNKKTIVSTVKDSGSASRFFYCAKSSKSERNKGLDSICTVKYNGFKNIERSLWKDANMELATLLKRVMSELTIKWSIGECGESITGECQSDSLSTTLTEINKITTSQILPLLTPLLINVFTQVANSETGNGGNLAESVESSSQSILNTTKESLEYPLGVVNAVSQMLSAIKEEGNWKELTNFHSTVKPIALMRYLCRLITPPNGIVLDPFMGSGTTGCACALEGFKFIGIEREADYVKIAEARIDYWQKQQPEEDEQTELAL